MAAPHSCIPFLYAIAEKGRKDKEGTDQEQARAHKRYDGLGNTVLARVHLYVKSGIRTQSHKSRRWHNRELGRRTSSLPRSRASSPAHRPPTRITLPLFDQSRTGDDGTKRTLVSSSFSTSYSLSLTGLHFRLGRLSKRPLEIIALYISSSVKPSDR